MAYTKYSLTPANNTAAPPDGAPEGMLPSAVNDTMRDMMAQIRDVGDGIRGGTYTMTAPIITGGTINGATIGATTASTGNFTTLGATGVATFSAGTVSSPAITTTGDTNTGIFFPAADTIAFTEGGVESMRIDSSGNVLVGITSARANAGDVQVSKGISFPATQSAQSDANTLDDYEEGTWTPTIGASTTLPTSVTYVTQTGRYTKIGRMVSIQGRLQISAISGGVGNFAINGLPFANSANIVGAGLSWFSNVNLSSGYTTAGLYFAGNDAFLSLAESGDNVGVNQLSIGTIGATFDIAFSFTYIV